MDCLKNTVSLLIEPVWNRNVPTSLYSSGSSPFNRTSMESKYFAICCSISAAVTFNRTSMESKCELNLTGFAGTSSTFNRTSMESKSGSQKHDGRACPNLLIEPVWNRNNTLTSDHAQFRISFNRTSMESKL